MENDDCFADRGRASAGARVVGGYGVDCGGRDEGRRKGWVTKDSGIRKKKRGDRRTSDRAAAVSKSPNKAEHARVEQGTIEEPL